MTAQRPRQRHARAAGPFPLPRPGPADGLVRAGPCTGPYGPAPVRVVPGLVRAVHGLVRAVHGLVRAVHGPVRPQCPFPGRLQVGSHSGPCWSPDRSARAASKDGHRD
jgi:hypothetical protein